MDNLTLNLLHSERSEIGYRIFTFNDGEPHIEIDNDFDHKNFVTVRCRIASPNDLFLLMQVGDILNRHGVAFRLEIAYLMSMRMDRVISFGEAFSLRIVCAVLNNLAASSIRVLEPHSSRVDMLLCNFEAVCGINQTPGIVFDNDIIVHPDAGAAERYEHDQHTKITAYKKRDIKTGKILSLDLTVGSDDIVNAHPGSPFLVVDDLCDGGGTFVRLAKLLEERYPDRQRRIYVTHMVNKNGITALADNYDEVIFTNSYCDWIQPTIRRVGPENVRMVDIDKEWR